MNKTIEALKLAEEALQNNLPFNYVQNTHGEKFPCFSNDPLREVKTREALAAIREALAEPVCEHRIADARNEFVKDGYICIKCGALFRAADHAEPVKQEPVACLHGVEDNACIQCYFDNVGLTTPKPAKEPMAYDVIDKCISLVGTEMVECKEASDTWFLCQRLIHAMRDMQYELKNAAPVDAKAIRAEALEEAAAMGESRQWNDEFDCAAAIRGLK